MSQIRRTWLITDQNAWVKEFAHLGSENGISWIFGLVFENVQSENRITEIRKNQGPGAVYNVSSSKKYTNM